MWAMKECTLAYSSARLSRFPTIDNCHFETPTAAFSTAGLVQVHLGLSRSIESAEARDSSAIVRMIIKTQVPVSLTIGLLIYNRQRDFSCVAHRSTDPEAYETITKEGVVRTVTRRIFSCEIEMSSWCQGVGGTCREAVLSSSSRFVRLLWILTLCHGELPRCGTQGEEVV
ncbi:hypothetical protein EDC04DRAFT_1386012 [Pisolithus marmoratus]|nr:hypothetical protein EDC04DRAFT_1386012 [Pisolithus marmoratus]